MKDLHSHLTSATAKAAPVAYVHNGVTFFFVDKGDRRVLARHMNPYICRDEWKQNLITYGGVRYKIAVGMANQMFDETVERLRNLAVGEDQWLFCDLYITRSF